MRVLVVHNRYRSDSPSGENRVVEREVEELRNRGIDVVAHLRSSDEIAPMPALRRAAVAVGPIRTPGGTAALDGVLATAGPDVVHVHNVYPLVSPAIVALAHRRGIPVVQTVHNYRHVCMSGWLYRDERYCDDCVGRRFPLPGVAHGCYRGSRVQSTAMALGRWRHRDTWRSVDRLLAITDFVRDRLVDDGFDAARLSVKHNFVPDPGPAPGDWGAREHVVCFAARLSAEKGVDVLLDAWRRARLGRPWRLVIAGDGPSRILVEQAARADPSIEVVGQLAADGVGQLLQRARVAVVASSAADPGTLAVPEAFAHGTPVIAVDAGGVGELVGAAGRRTTREGLVDELARLGSSAAAAEFGGLAGAARARYESTFAPGVVMPQLLETYEMVIDGAREHRG